MDEISVLGVGNPFGRCGVLRCTRDLYAVKPYNLSVFVKEEFAAPRTYEGHMVVKHLAEKHYYINRILVN